MSTSASARPPGHASRPRPSTRVPAARRRESGSGACLDLQVIDTVRSGRDREDAAMHHLLCGGLYKPRRRVRAGRASESRGGARFGEAMIQGFERQLAPACGEL